jgi:alpha-D-ribose 1-methylphosphonate 5-triphosphate diphosphatase
MMICMGAPNYYRGGSHCGNLAFHDAMAENLVDIICSDYHFPSMLACALRMAEEGMPLPDAIRMFTLHPALHLGLDGDKGSIEIGKQADLVAFYPRNGYGGCVCVLGRGQERVFSSMNCDNSGRADEEDLTQNEETAVSAV